MKSAVLFANIGTPDSPEPEDVGRYLKEFLGDPEVINLPAPIRYILVNWLIVPKRKYQSAEAYKAIWTDEGSPLDTITRSLVKKLNNELGEDIEVFTAMRYGNHSISDVIQKLKSFDRLYAFPAFPQFANATTTSMLNEANRVNKRTGKFNDVIEIKEFYDSPFFVEALAASIQKLERPFDHLLFSYHGLPVSHIKRDDPSPNQQRCLTGECCSDPEKAKGRCYRAQCFQTSFAVAKSLSMPSEKYSISFQSRLGRAEWIQPYTSDHIKQLAEKGVKNLAVICPAFVVDCLETLEEVGIGLKEEFIEAGGEDLQLVPCLNDDDQWAKALAAYITQSVAEDL